MSENETVPPATLYRWQRAAQRLLADFLADGAQNGLPPLMWTLASTGALTGEADSLSYPTPDEQRDAVQRWADYVGVDVDRRTHDGREELFAGWKIKVKDAIGPVSGCFRATIFLYDETPQPERPTTEHGPAAYFGELAALGDDPEHGAAARKLLDSHFDTFPSAPAADTETPR